ncbi:hypothetical protein Pelo_14384 [Pelomyxa schiedti]|nr:hypothetical protein Pelo_14384 [Pelomyxa schiedti]
MEIEVLRGRCKGCQDPLLDSGAPPTLVFVMRNANKTDQPGADLEHETLSNTAQLLLVGADLEHETVVVITFTSAFMVAAMLAVLLRGTL